jgi:hypothetical protein
LIWVLKIEVLVWILHMWIVSIPFHRSVTTTPIFPFRKLWIAILRNRVCRKFSLNPTDALFIYSNVKTD